MLRNLLKQANDFCSSLFPASVVLAASDGLAQGQKRQTSCFCLLIGSTGAWNFKRYTSSLGRIFVSASLVDPGFVYCRPCSTASHKKRNKNNRERSGYRCRS